MKRVRVCYPFVGDTVGGSHVSMVPVIKGISGAEFEPVVVVHSPGPLTDYLLARNLGFMEAPSRIVDQTDLTGQLSAMLQAATRLVPFLRRNNIDIVHTNDGRMHLTWGLAARLAGSRFVWHQRSAGGSRRVAQYSRLANAVLTISRYCKGAFASPMSERAQVILDPITVGASAGRAQATRRRLCEALGVDVSAPIIGFVGNLTAQKRPGFFVEVAAVLRDLLEREAGFPMFGEERAGLANEVRARIDALELSGRCKLMGPRYPIEPWIAACDVLLAPAKGEGLGRTLVEAMLIGTPVVAADHAGHREVITSEDTGFLAPPEDAGAFADAVVELVGNGELRKVLCTRARAFARETFSEEKHLREIAEVYGRLLDRVSPEPDGT